MLVSLGIFLGSGIFFQSCESVLFIELEEGVRLIVVNGAIGEGDSVAVQVSRTRHILDNAPVVPLEDATVRLFEDGQLWGTLPYKGNGYYSSDALTPRVGRTYAVEVEHLGYDPVRAESSIPATVPILGLDTTTKIIASNDMYNYYGGDIRNLQFDLTLEDPAGEENYYLLSAWVDRAITEYRTDTTYLLVDTVLVDGKPFVWVRDTTHALYDINRYTQYAYIVSEDILVEGFSTDGVLFSDQLIDGQSYSFRGLIQAYQLESADSSLLEFRLNSISEDYYKYLKSRQEHYIAKDEPLAVPVIVYSNVTDGTGFLGGFSYDQRTITTFVPEPGPGYFGPW